MSDERELLDDVARTLRQAPSFGPELDARVMAAVRAEHRHVPTPTYVRALRPRTITFSPLSWGLVAAGALLFAGGAGAMLSAQFGHASAKVASDTARQVQFTLVAPNASKVAVVGDFNHWNAAHPAFQAKHNGGGVWTVTAKVPVGAHEYSFVVDDSVWKADPTAPRVIDNDFGLPKSSMVVGADQ